MAPTKTVLSHSARVSLAEVAELRDVPISTLRNWVSKPAYGFPAHVAMEGRTRVWLWGKVKDYQPPRKPGRPRKN